MNNGEEFFEKETKIHSSQTRGRTRVYLGEHLGRLTQVEGFEWKSTEPRYRATVMRNLS